MSDDARIAVLEERVERLTQDLAAERLEFNGLKKEFTETKREVTTAKTVGRLAIWMLLGASAFLTQVQGLLAWIRKG